MGTQESRGSREEKECEPSLLDFLHPEQHEEKSLGEHSQGGDIVKGSLVFG